LANVEGWYAGLGGKPDNIEMRIGDVFEQQLQEVVDRIVLDVPQPWEAVGTTTEALVSGGIMCCYLPTVPQVMQTVEAMRAGGFGWIETIESLVRTWNVQGQSVRPDHRMIGHTGFLVIGRKLTGG
jgi:tRNA (adenine57-N1/adenine58-N1)-methyltransferase